MPTLELDDIQGLVARGYGQLRAARFVLFKVNDPAAAGRWLGVLAGAATTAAAGPAPTTLNVAFTASGLQRLGLPEPARAGFSNEFRDGMTTPHRQRALGDTGPDDPEGWRWGGPATEQVDGVLMLYATDDLLLSQFATTQTVALQTGGLDVIATLQASDHGNREPFGFRDGISQPAVEGLTKPAPAANTVSAGEFVLGYPNEYGLLTASPLVAAPDDPDRMLLAGGGEARSPDFGRNGTYLVLRQLEQDVPGFWRFLDEASRESDGAASAERRTALAAKMVGRWPGGAPLATSPGRDDPDLSEANDFGYHATDPHGMACPIGAHVRRSNPRDSLDPEPGSEKSIALNKRHRILRRGRPYGPPISVDAALEGEGGDEERGLFFVCVNANIARQFEFVQHTWANNPKFGELYDDVDPLIGPRGPEGAAFTVQDVPVRRRVRGMPSFVTVRGGAYFFLPGIRALRYLAGRAAGLG